MTEIDMLAPASIREIVLKLDAWFETMRGPAGYGGPVAHWWQDCLRFTGAGLDWRYEGIINGYLNLFERTGQAVWRDKARRAGDDLVAGQQANRNFRNSSFEANPRTGGTPHEAACDLALIRLAHTMRSDQVAGWELYAQAAERNIRGFILGQLWDPEANYFHNLIGDPIFVPNKAATIVEALSAWMEFTAEEEWIAPYILPSLEKILLCQVYAPGTQLDGAIDQAYGVKKREGWFFPYYIARCIPALTLGHQVTNQKRFLKAAGSALDFILRVRFEDGSFPQALRANGRVYRYPQWVAGTGDILRAMACLEADIPPGVLTKSLDWMLKGLLPSGGIRTASGFARKSRWPRLSNLPDFRDLLPVAGWADKAFRFLTTQLSGEPGSCEFHLEPFEQLCQFRGRICTYREDHRQIAVHHQGKIVYRWEKGRDRAVT